MSTGPPARRSLEDFAVGQRFVSPATYVMEVEQMTSFARQFDPQPIHVDPSAARGELFGGLVASGWLTLAATTRLVLLADLLGATPTVGVSIDNLRFLQPVRPGDVLTAVAEVIGTRPSASRPDRGYLHLRVVTLRRPNDEPVLTQDWTLLLPLRRA